MAVDAPADVPGGGDNDDACPHGALRGQRQRIGVVRLVHASRDRQIDHADVQGLPLRHRIVERRYHVADVSPARAVEGLEHDEMCSGSDTRARPAGVKPVARDDARDVRTVAVVVIGRRGPADEIDEPIDAHRAGIIRKVVMPGRHSRIDDGDAHAGAVVAELLPHDRGADGRARSLHGADDVSIERDVVDKRTGGQPPQQRVGNQRDVAADVRKATPECGAELLDDRSDARRRHPAGRADDHSRLSC